MFHTLIFQTRNAFQSRERPIFNMHMYYREMQFLMSSSLGELSLPRIPSLSLRRITAVETSLQCL